MRKILMAAGIVLAVGLPSFTHAAASWFDDDAVSTTGLWNIEIASSRALVSGDMGYVAASSDYGRTWTDISTGGVSSYTGAYITGSTYFVASSNGVIKRLLNGGSWETISSGFGERLYDFSGYGSSIWAVGESGHIVVSSNSGASFSLFETGEPATLWSVDQASNYAWAVGDSGTAFKKAPGSSLWSSASTGTTKNLHDVEVTSYTTSTVATIWIAGQDALVKKSTNAGSTWSTISVTGMPATDDIWGIEVSGSSVMVITENAAYLSTDSGATWSQPAWLDAADGEIFDLVGRGDDQYSLITLRSLYVLDRSTPTAASGFGNASGTVTNDTTPDLSWTAGSDSYSAISHRVAMDTATTEPVDTTLSAATLSYTWPSALADGEYTFTLTAVDESSNESSALTTTVLIDATAPAVAMSSPANPVGGETYNLLITATDQNGVALCGAMVDAMPPGLGGEVLTQLDDDTWNLELTAATGSHNVLISCIDEAENTGTASLAMTWTDEAPTEPADAIDSTEEIDDGVSDEPIVDEPVDNGGAIAGDNEEEAESGEAAAGDLIKMVCDETMAVDVNDPCKAVYYYDMTLGKRHAFPNERVYFTWYVDFDAIVEVTDIFMASLALGGNVTYHPGTTMVKFITVNTVYAVGEEGELRAVASEDVATSIWGANWNQQIHDISDAFFGNYDFGDDIDSTSDFDSDTAEASVDLIDDIL